MGTPTPGRMVMFRSARKYREPLPAIVVRVRAKSRAFPQTIDLGVIGPNYLYVTSVPEDDRCPVDPRQYATSAHKPGTWRWPAIV